MADEKYARLHEAPIEKFTSFYLYPFHCKGQVKPPGDWEQRYFQIPIQENELKESWEMKKNYAEYIYFHDYVRCFLFPQKAETNEVENMVRFYKHCLTDAVVTIETLEGKRLSALMAGVYLYRFPNDIWILVLEVSNTTDDEEKKKDTLINDLISTADELLLFNNMFRRVYPAYFEKNNPYQQMESNEFPKSVSIRSENFQFSNTYSPDSVYLKQADLGKNYSITNRCYPEFKTPVTELLNSFFQLGPRGKTTYRPILDDRMLVHCYVAFPEFVKQMVTLEQDDIFFSHFLYVDNPDNTYRYDSVFVRNLMQKHEYGRWNHYRTRMGFTRYSSAFFYFSHADYLYRPFVSMYFQMFLLITYYRATLIRFSNDIAEIAKSFKEENEIPTSLKLTIRGLHTRFVKFMNAHWFTEVSNQDQGIEIFQKMREAFELEPMYQQVKDEIERAHELVELIHQHQIEKFQDAAGKIGVLVGFLAVWTGFLGMNFTDIDFLRDSVWKNPTVFYFVATIFVTLNFFGIYKIITYKYKKL